MHEWHLPFYDDLIRRWQTGKLPHALLLAGESDIGRELMARTLAQTLLCYTPVSSAASPILCACGNCHSCSLFNAMTHPDFYMLGLEVQNDQEAKNIKIDQIRDLCQRLTLKSQNGGMKVVIINPADRMNHNAANSLLKTLEEPAAGTLIILVTAHAARLLPTVRSRCQKISLPTPSSAMILQFLSEHYPGGNAEKLRLAGVHEESACTPEMANTRLEQRDVLLRSIRDLAARKQDVTEVAEICVEQAPERALLWFSRWVEDLIRIGAGVDDAWIVNIDFKSDLQEQTNRVDLKRLLDFYTELNKARSVITASVNVPLLLESVLLSWSGLFVQMKKRA